jgi:hypothetical protein
MILWKKCDLRADQRVCDRDAQRINSFGLLNQRRLAEQLQRNPRTLDRWAVLGMGPPRTRVGRKVLYRRRSVQKWLVAQEQATAS